MRWAVGPTGECSEPWRVCLVSHRISHPSSPALTAGTRPLSDTMLLLTFLFITGRPSAPPLLRAVPVITLSKTAFVLSFRGSGKKKKKRGKKKEELFEIYADANFGELSPRSVDVWNVSSLTIVYSEFISVLLCRSERAFCYVRLKESSVLWGWHSLLLSGWKTFLLCQVVRAFCCVRLREMSVMSGCKSLLLCQIERGVCYVRLWEPFCCVRLRKPFVVSDWERRLLCQVERDVCYVRLRDPFVVSGSERCLFYQLVRAFCCVRLWEASAASGWESLLLCQVESEKKKKKKRKKTWNKIYCQRCETIQMTQKVGKKSHFNQTIQNGSKRGAGVCLLFLWLVVWGLFGVLLCCCCFGGRGRMGGGTGTYFACL